MSEVRAPKTPRTNSRWLGNLVSFVVSLVFIYFVLGALYLRLAPGLMPVLSSQVPMAAILWWQPAAPDPSSNDYIALLGDSYAEGVGDWKAEQVDFTSPSHSADVIHDLSGRNVLSYGRRGAGSAEGLVRLPAEALGAGDCFYFPSLLLPQEVVYYFYEGNDLEDNIQFINERLGLSVGAAGINQASISFLEHNWGNPGLKPCLLYFGKSIKSLVKTARKTIRHRLDADLPKTPPIANRALINGEVVDLPGSLQGPGLDLEEHAVAAAFDIFKVSLSWLKETLPGIKITIVHLPSVLSTYNLVGPRVSVENVDKSTSVYPTTEVDSRSDDICRRLRHITLRSGAKFFDARPAMRELATQRIIHGPRDWTHFNQAGYTHLGDTVASVLDGERTSSDCGQLGKIL